MPTWDTRTLTCVRLGSGCLLATMSALLAASAPARAYGEPAQTPAIPVDPPVLTSRSEPIYPEGVHEHATVAVELVVDALGNVETARIIEGDAPFAEAALVAAKSSRFSPAKREGKPVRAKIRALFEFSPPEPMAPPAPVPANGESNRLGNPPANTVAPAHPPVAPVPEIVQVKGRRYETQSATEQRLGRAEMRMMAGAFGDPFRAIDILPGVVPTISGLPYYYVRGAPPAAIGYFVDEVRVPYLFHFGLGPGVIHPALVSEVALHPAAFPARYGRYSGAIVAGETKDPAPAIAGEALIRLFDAGAFIETPIAHGRGSVAVGGRYSYTAALLSLLLPEASIQYRDYNARFTYKLGERTRFTAFAFGAYDYASSMTDSVNEQTGGKERKENILFAYEYHRLDLRLDHDGDGQAHSRLALTLGHDRTRIESARFAGDSLVQLRGRHRQHLSDALEFEAGFDVAIDLYRGDLPSVYAVSKEDYASASSLYMPRTESATGAWVQALAQPTKAVELTATLRADVFSSLGKVALGPSPRASGKLKLTKDVTAVFALGVAPQTPAFAFPLPAVGYAGLPGGLSYGYQKSAGIEAVLPYKMKLRAVGFHHTYFNLRDPFSDRQNFDLNTPQVTAGGPGQAFGLEVYLARKMSERFSATLSYTLSRSQLGSIPTRASMLSPFDRTHVVQLAGAVDLGRNWRASSRIVGYSGWPKPVRDAEGNARLPFFLRLDVRVEKRWSWRKNGYFALIFEGLNATAAKEVLNQTCDSAGKCVNQDFGPVTVPSIGVEAAL